LQPTTSNGSYCASQQNGVLDFRFGSKADICTAAAHVRFTPNSDRESEFPQRAMSALPPKADMCSALAYVRFGPRADADVSANRWLIRQAYRRVEQVRPGLQRQ